jgi:hypothetical protein
VFALHNHREDFGVQRLHNALLISFSNFLRASKICAVAARPPASRRAKSNKFSTRRGDKSRRRSAPPVRLVHPPTPRGLGECHPRVSPIDPPSFAINLLKERPRPSARCEIFSITGADRVVCFTLSIYGNCWSGASEQLQFNLRPRRRTFE